MIKKENNFLTNFNNSATYVQIGETSAQKFVVKKLKAGTKYTFAVKAFKNQKLKSGKTCYYKVRAYVTAGGRNVYGAYSQVKAVKAK